jgi:mono/diheme cytochrome c family protein
MRTNERRRRCALVGWGMSGAALVGLAVAAALSGEARGGPLWARWFKCHGEAPCPGPGEGPGVVTEFGGNWYWMRSPEEEKRHVAGLYNRYCVRCHGVDGRGVWDIPDVPDFASRHWQSYRTDGQLARSILEGRGAVMPPFRGTLSLEECWAMARYLRTLAPGNEAPRPEQGAGGDKAAPGK